MAAPADGVRVAPADATAVPEEWDAINSDFDDRDFLVQRGDILVAQLEETGLDDDGDLDVEARDTGAAWLAQVIEDHDTEVAPGLWRYRFRRLTPTTIRQWCVGDLRPPLPPL